MRTVIITRNEVIYGTGRIMEPVEKLVQIDVSESTRIDFTGIDFVLNPIHDTMQFPEEYAPIIYCYSPNKGFYLNPAVYTEGEIAALLEGFYAMSNDKELPEWLVSKIKDEAITEVQEGAING